MRATRSREGRDAASGWTASSDTRGLLESLDGAVGHDPLAHAGEQLAGADLDEAADAGGVQGPHGLAPAHGSHERLGELRADVVERASGRARDDGKAGGVQLDLVERRAERG